MSTRPPFETDALESVLSLAVRGWQIHPCAERGKTPLLKDWPHRASRDADVIRRWAQKYKGCNWGVLCGADSGVWVQSFPIEG
jgi:hypothetical protein